jgi:hypothetical protein
MFLGLPDPSLYFGRIRALPSTSKKKLENLDFYYFVTYFDFLSMKTGVNVLSSKQKNFLKTFLLTSCRPLTKKAGRGSGSVSKCHGSTTLVPTALLLLYAEFTVPYSHVPKTAAYA